MYFKRVGEQVFVLAPHLADNRFRAQPLAFVQRQRFQNLRYLGRQLQPLIPHIDLMAAGVDPQRTAADDNILAYETPSGQIADAREQLFKVKRFDQVIIRAQVKPLHFIPHRTAGR